MHIFVCNRKKILKLLFFRQSLYPSKSVRSIQSTPIDIPWHFSLFLYKKKKGKYQAFVNNGEKMNTFVTLQFNPLTTVLQQIGKHFAKIYTRERHSNESLAHGFSETNILLQKGGKTTEHWCKQARKEVKSRWRRAWISRYFFRLPLNVKVRTRMNSHCCFLPVSISC